MRYRPGMLHWDLTDWLTASATIGVILIILVVSWRRGQ
jgi:hypothetical protein